MFRPADGLGLAVFRVMYGALMAGQFFAYGFGGVGARYEVPVRFTWPGFHWVAPAPHMDLVFLACGVAALLVMVGLFYRAAAAVVWAGITWTFLLDQTDYLNHFYFLVLVGAMMVVVPAHRTLSLDARRRPPETTDVPRWCYWLLVGQITVLYVFGGIAKLNGDWLRAQPLKIWLTRPDRVERLGDWLEWSWLPWAMSYAGLLYDLLVAPALLWRRTRALAMVASFGFHLLNAVIFGIGVFPWTSLACNTLFFDPGWPRRFGVDPPRWPAPGPFPARRRRLLVAALTVHFAIQCLVPLRHWLYPGNVSWTEEGHNFAWHMKLRHKDATVRFLLVHRETKRVLRHDPQRLLTPRQVYKMASRPHLIRQYAHELARRHPGYAVHAQSHASLNGRPWQRFIDSSVDLARQPWRLGPQPFILPLEHDLP